MGGARAPAMGGGAALLAGALALNVARVNAETRPAESDGGRVLDLPGGALHVLEEGPPDAPVVLVLHGLAGSLRWFDRLAPLLAADRRVVRIDLLGHGGSAKPSGPYGIPDQARLVAAAADRLELRPGLVVGHSFGGAVAVALAERRPELVPRVAILDEGPDNSFGVFPLLARIGFAPVIGHALHRVVPDPLVRDGYRDAFAKGFDLASGFRDPDQVVRDYRRMTFTSYRESQRGEHAFLDEERLDARLRRLGIPALVVFGEEDTFFRARESADAFEQLPAVDVAVLEGVGHSPNVECPERVAQLLRPLV